MSAESAPRGDVTRRRLLDAALEAFSSHGFDGVTTRQLAQQAGVNLAAIPYHFGGKEGIYRALIEEIANELGVPLRRAARAAQAAAAAPGQDRATRCAHLAEFLRAMARQLLGSSDARLRAGIVFREQMQPTPAFDLLYETYIGPVHEAVSALVGAALDRPADDPDVILRAHAALGQVIIFRAARATILRRMGWERLAPEHVEDIARVVSDQVCNMLLGGATTGTKP